MNCLKAGFCRFYAEGGYESSSSKYKAGVAEILVEEGRKLLASIR